MLLLDKASPYISLDEIYGCTPGMDQDIEAVEQDEPPEVGESLDWIGREIQIYHTVDDMCTSPYIPEKHGILYLGYDIAKKRDATSIFLLGLLPDGRKRVYGYEELRAKDFEYQLNCIRQLMKSLPIRRICLDSTGMGAPICERLEKEFPAQVEGIDFNVQNKEEMAQGIKIGLQKHEFILPNDKNLHHQIHSIRRIPTTGGHFRYDADRDENGHADSFWSFALANLACGKASSTGFYQQRSIKKLETIKKEIESAGVSQDQKIVIPRGKSLRQINKMFGL